MKIQTVQHIRSMRDGAQSRLMRCSNGNFYIVKFQNNPQHTRVLANNWLGTCLAVLVGLSVPTRAIIAAHPWLVEHTAELRFVCTVLGRSPKASRSVSLNSSEDEKRRIYGKCMKRTRHAQIYLIRD